MVRALLILLTCLAIPSVSAPARAAEDPRYAAFVADLGEGRVLHARRADAPRHPASLTKMMTLYVLFDAIEDGVVALDDEITASAEAASRPPSRLGLTRGARLDIETAIRALVIKSANDVAVAVAEHLAGDEAAFAVLMTERARGLGMDATTFRNASGLPDAEQLTSARDMARLAAALRRDHPEFLPYFAETAFSWNGRTYRSHNHLLGDVEGADGMKTGYIRASGFNIAATASREGADIVAVVMGGASAAARDAHARELIEAAYSVLAPEREPAPVLVAETAAEAYGVEFGSGLVEAGPAGAWAIQVGAFSSEAAAWLRLNEVSAAARNFAPALPAGRAHVQAAAQDERRFWRARFSNLSEETAHAACLAILNAGGTCFTLYEDAL